MKNKNNITFYEWENKSYEKLEIKKEYFNELKKYLKKNKLNNVFNFGLNEISSQNYVGVIKYKKYSFSILPKISDKNEDNETIYKNLIYMLSVTKSLNINITNINNLSKSNNSFLEILIRYFAENLFNNLKISSINNYIREENNLNCVKGKINWTKNIKYNICNKAKFYCEYDEFSENNLLNQLFLFVSRMLFYISNDSYNKKILTNIINYYINVDFVVFNIQKAEKIKLTRNQELFKNSFNLAKMFIENSVINLNNGKIENISIIWDMNILFEEFIYRVMNRYKEKEMEVEYQKKQHLFSNDKEGINTQTYSDIVLTINNEKIIIDTKYKNIDNYDSQNLYQVITYTLINNNCNKAILLFPEQDKKKYGYREKYGVVQNTIKEINLMTIDLCKKDLEKDIKGEIEEFFNNIKKVTNIL